MGTRLCIRDLYVKFSQLFSFEHFPHKMGKYMLQLPAFITPSPNASAWLLKLRIKNVCYTCPTLFPPLPMKPCAVTTLISSLSLTYAVLIFSFTLLCLLFLLPEMAVSTHPNLASPPFRSCWMHPSLWSIDVHLLPSLWFNANSIVPYLVDL